MGAQPNVMQFLIRTMIWWPAVFIVAVWAYYLAKIVWLLAKGML